MATFVCSALLGGWIIGLEKRMEHDANDIVGFHWKRCVILHSVVGKNSGAFYFLWFYDKMLFFVGSS